MDASAPVPVFFTRRLSRAQLIALDALGAVGYTVLLIATLATESPAKGSGTPWWAACTVTAATGLPVAFRRLWPVPVLALVLAATTASVFMDTVRDPFIAAAFVLYTVGLTEPARRRVPWIAIGVPGVVGAFGTPLTSAPYWWMGGPGLILFGWAAMGGAWTLGRAVHDRRAAFARSAERLAETAVAEERLRIAREMHDVVTHSIGLIAVKAGVANHVLRTRPEEAHDALRVIESVSRGALTEMRQMLGVLRSDAEAARSTASFGPLPGVAGLTRLAEQAEAAGVSVALDLRGADRLSESLGRTVHRIVQESLTNAARHAAPTHCRVTVEGDGREVRIEVADDGPGGRPHPVRDGPGGGDGIIGMRERASVYGGELHAGPRPDGGFAVRARLPYDGPAAPAGPGAAGGPGGGPGPDGANGGGPGTGGGGGRGDRQGSGRTEYA